MVVEQKVSLMRPAMNSASETSDVAILDLLRRAGALNVSKLALATGVTATAVRQRLNRLMGQGLIERETARAGRGRPSHRYSLTDKGRRQTGANFADLALALWRDIRAIQDPQVRRGLYQRVARHLAALYEGRVTGTTPRERMQDVAEIFRERNVPFRVDEANRLPVLTALACPYPQLADEDRGVCAMERMLMQELVGQDVRLAECRLDGDSCCRFETNELGC